MSDNHNWAQWATICIVLCLVLRWLGGRGSKTMCLHYERLLLWTFNCHADDDGMRKFTYTRTITN